MRIATSILIVSLGAAAAAQPRMSAPVAGYVFDASSGSVRAIAGVPGAAAAGGRIPFSVPLVNAFTHPTLALAIGVTKDGFVLAGRSKPEAVIAASLGVPLRVAFAAGSDSAALINNSGVEVWTGLTADSPSSLFAYGADALTGVPQTVSMSADGSVAAVGLDSGNIVEVSQNGIRLLGPGKAAAYMSSDLATLGLDGSLTTSNGNSLAAGLEPDTELSSMTGLNGLVALSASKGTLTLIDASSGQTSRLYCGSGCQPGHGQALSVNGLLYFVDPSRGGLMLDASATTPRIVPVAGIGGGGNQ